MKMGIYKVALYLSLLVAEIAQRVTSSIRRRELYQDVSDEVAHVIIEGEKHGE